MNSQYIFHANTHTALTVGQANGIDSSREVVVAAQDVDLNLPLETPLGISGDDNDQVAPQTRLGRSKVKNLDEFLENLPILSVGQKHQAKFDCELSSELETFRVSEDKFQELFE